MVREGEGERCPGNAAGNTLRQIRKARSIAGLFSAAAPTRSNVRRYCRPDRRIRCSPKALSSAASHVRTPASCVPGQASRSLGNQLFPVRRRSIAVREPACRRPHYGTVIRKVEDNRHVRCAAYANSFVLLAHGRPAVPSLVELGIARVQRLQIQILLIYSKDGETPANALIVSRGDTWQTWLSGTNDVPAWRVQMHYVAQ